MGVWIVFFIAVLLGVTRTIPARVNLRRFDSCVGCRHSLAGLDAQADCPNCGRSRAALDVRRVPAHTEGADDPHVWVACFCCGLCLFVMWCFSPTLAVPVAAISYRLDGYAWSTGFRAAEIRDLTGPEVDYSLLFGSPAMRVLQPLLIGMALTPLCLRLPTWRTRMIRMAVLLSSSLLLTIGVPVLEWLLQ